MRARHTPGGGLDGRQRTRPGVARRLGNVDWDTYVALSDANRNGGLRFAYLEGDLEIMSPSLAHETSKSMIRRRLEAYAEERDIDLNAFASTTFRRKKKKRGFEADESYVLGASADPEHVKRPDLAIEVVYTSWSIDKLDIYLGFGVPEVWVYREGAIGVHVRTDDGYAERTRSALLPELDLALLASFVERTDQSPAIREYRRSLRGDAPTK